MTTIWSISISILISSSSSKTPKPRHHKNPKRSRTHHRPPISISTDPSHLNPHHLQHLLLSSNLSCHRFPPLSSPDGKPDPVDIHKLTVAIAHSFVVVSVFCRDRFLRGNDDHRQHPIGMPSSGFGFGEMFERMVTVPESDHRLVGFGRAVSDGGLTASIHDVVVMPSLQRLGIGRKIVGRIVRVLTGRGIYDISALCSEKERLFFETCGFGEDSLGSTTMMYTRVAPCLSQDNLTVSPAGRMLLLVPPSRGPFLSKSSLQTSTEDP